MSNVYSMQSAHWHPGVTERGLLRIYLVDANGQEVIPWDRRFYKDKVFSCLFFLDWISCLTQPEEEHLSQTLIRKEPTGVPEWGLSQRVAHRGEYCASEVGSEICKAWLRMEIGLSDQNLTGSRRKLGTRKGEGLGGRRSRAGLLSTLGGLIQESLNTLKAKVQRSFPGIKVVWGLGN